MLSLKLLVIKDRRRQEGLRGRNQLSPEVWSPHVEGRREVPGDGTLAGPHPLLTLLRCLLREAGDRTVEDIHWQLSYRDYTGTDTVASSRLQKSDHRPGAQPQSSKQASPTLEEPEERFLPRSGSRIPPTPPCSSRADAGGGTREHSGAGPERRPLPPRPKRLLEAGLWAGPADLGAGTPRSSTLDRAAAGRERMAGVVPAGCGPAPGRHCRAGPRSCAPLSLPVAEHSRAAGLTGLPPTPAGISPTARQVYTSLARVVRVPQPWRLGDGLSSGPPTKEAHVRENHLFFAAPEAPVGTIVS